MSAPSETTAPEALPKPSPPKCEPGSRSLNFEPELSDVIHHMDWEDEAAPHRDELPEWMRQQMWKTGLVSAALVRSADAEAGEAGSWYNVNQAEAQTLSQVSCVFVHPAPRTTPPQHWGTHRGCLRPPPLPPPPPRPLTFPPVPTPHLPCARRHPGASPVEPLRSPPFHPAPPPD